MYQAYTTLKTTVQKLIPALFLKRLVTTFHLMEAVFANICYGFPARGMKCIGVTGTNGKTTTSLMTATILEAAGYKVGLSSSALIKEGGELRLNDLPGRLTNPNPFVLQKLLRQMKSQGVEWVVIESGSIGLHQHRLWGINFEAAVFTNLTEDHLDYHGTMEKYAQAKGILFTHTKGVAVINRDDSFADYFLSLSTPRKVTYGQSKEANYHLEEITLKQSSTEVTLRVDGSLQSLNLKLVGQFNAYNAAAALAATHELGVDTSVAIKALEGLIRIPGRLDAVHAGQKFSVLIDDAHTPDAIENVLKAARAISRGTLYIITGAAGERAGSRRGPVGRIASTLADVFIICDDEPHHDNPDPILEDIQHGTVKNKAKIMVIKDRCDAMRQAFQLAKDTDTIVIAGMGYKHHRDGPRGQEPWDDYQVAKDLLEGKASDFDTNWRTVMHEVWPDIR